MNNTSTLIHDTSMEDTSTPPDAPGRWRTRTKVLLGAGIAVFGIVGGVLALDGALSESRHSTVRYTDAVAALDVDMSVGTLRVVGSSSTTVTVDVTTHGGIREGSHSETLVGDRLRLHSECGFDLISPSCAVDYVVHVPAGTEIVAHGDGTDLHVTGTRGNVDVSLNGGSADMTFASSPNKVRAHVNGGRVTVALPDDGSGYRVDADADGGSTHVDIRTDPTSDRLIEAHANGGNINVRYVAAQS